MDVPSARAFALSAHASQQYGDESYSVHLDAVARIAAPYGESAQIIAYLHDVVEDTEIQLTQVQEHFGMLVAECVALLTDEPGQNRKERKSKTYAKLAKVSGATELALIVKASDRLANVRACVAGDKRDLWLMYETEHPIFRTSAYRAGLCEPIWTELNKLLSTWPVDKLASFK